MIGSILIFYIFLCVNYDRPLRAISSCSFEVIYFYFHALSKYLSFHSMTFACLFICIYIIILLLFRILTLIMECASLRQLYFGLKEKEVQELCSNMTSENSVKYVTEILDREVSSDNVHFAHRKIGLVLIERIPL